jgi:hypothetical protein
MGMPVIAGTWSKSYISDSRIERLRICKHLLKKGATFSPSGKIVLLLRCSFSMLNSSFLKGF